MIPVVLLKILGDLGFYYSFAGFFAVVFGAKADMLLTAAAIQAAAFTLSFVLSSKEKLRFVPIAATLGIFALPGLCIAFALAVIPTEVYIFTSAKDKTYCPVWSASADLISLYSKVAILFSIISLVLGGQEHLFAVTVPFAIVTLFSTIMLTRSLRHDIDVYTSPLYQAMNAGTAVMLAAATLAVSSEAFRRTAGSVFRAVYLKAIMPVLLLFTQVMVYIFVGAVKAIKWLLNLLRIQGDEPILDEGDGAAGDIDLIQTEFDPNGHPLAKLVATVLIIAAACYVAYLLFKKLSGSRAREVTESTGETETRSFGLSRKDKSSDAAGSAAEKVRAQYRHYLKIYRKRNLPFDKSFTSMDILNASEKSFDKEASSGIRELYIKARYAERASKEDVEAAKEFVKIIKKSE